VTGTRQPSPAKPRRVTYGAQILESEIEDNPENFTRFFLIRRTARGRNRSEPNKMSLAFSVKNRPGSLVVALVELAAMGTNLTKIESRPVQGKPWEIASLWIARFARGKKARSPSRRSASLRHGQGTGFATGEQRTRTLTG